MADRLLSGLSDGALAHLENALVQAKIPKGGKCDPYGFQRGEHKRGKDVCAGFKYNGVDNGPAAAFVCQICGSIFEEHVIVEIKKPQPKERPAPRQQSAIAHQPRIEPQVRPGPGPGPDPSMLSEANDPLAIAAHPVKAEAERAVNEKAASETGSAGRTANADDDEEAELLARLDAVRAKKRGA